MPQKRSGFLVMTSGPGWMPWMIMAPTISAITALDGMPSVSMGMNEVWAAALLAASGAATPSTAPLPNSPGFLRELLLQRIGREGAQRRSAARQHAEQRTERGAAQDGRDGSADLLARRPQASRLLMAPVRFQVLLEIDDDLGDAEQAHGDRREVDAVAEFRNVEGEALGAGVDVGADQAEQQAEEHHGDRLGHRAAGQHDGRDEAERHQGAIVGGPEFLRHARSAARRRSR